jgi:hypothetical protein
MMLRYQIFYRSHRAHGVSALSKISEQCLPGFRCRSALPLCDSRVKFGQIYRLRIFTENISASIAKPRLFIFDSGDQRLIVR